MSAAGLLGPNLVCLVKSGEISVFSVPSSKTPTLMCSFTKDWHQLLDTPVGRERDEREKEKGEGRREGERRGKEERERESTGGKFFSGVRFKCTSAF